MRRDPVKLALIGAPQDMPSRAIKQAGGILENYTTQPSDNAGPTLPRRVDQEKGEASGAGRGRRTAGMLSSVAVPRLSPVCSDDPIQVYCVPQSRDPRAIPDPNAAKGRKQR